MLVCQRMAFRFWAAGWKMAVCWALPAKVGTPAAFALPFANIKPASRRAGSKFLPTRERIPIRAADGLDMGLSFVGESKTGFFRLVSASRLFRITLLVNDDLDASTVVFF